MPLYAPATSADFKRLEAGTYPAVLAQIVDLGTQHISSQQYGERDVRQVMLLWEIPSEIRDDGKPFCKQAKYTLSMASNANLRKIVESLVGVMTDDEASRFDVFTLIGKSAAIMLQESAGKNGKTYTDIKAVTPLMKGTPPVQLSGHTPVVTLCLEPDAFIEEYFDQVSEFTQETIRKSPEYQALVGKPAFVAEAAPQELPF